MELGWAGGLKEKRKRKHKQPY
ncbi:formin-like protein 6 [Iris pallida]|uniref:Formin-like protein 6 n=1 Tax=Iris pallida TaxID=29817 RepID=A0AAX6H2D0_IRIPA|nr:formin-like protein 6 [Iris pallida]